MEQEEEPIKEPETEIEPIREPGTPEPLQTNPPSLEDIYFDSLYYCLANRNFEAIPVLKEFVAKSGLPQEIIENIHKNLQIIMEPYLYEE